ncbi:hypothetical protein MFIFM68171_04782 [Madurella fahalii]|uniref:Methyltransferase type 11 domain-containing protein n=1 Tax=Madurella fahalii TaxID=1157608 RepID=A0ABQ0G9Y6_9PEZI
MPWNLKDRVNAYTETTEIRYAIWALWAGSKEAFRNGGFRALLDIRALQDAGFHLWYKTLNVFALEFEQTKTPLPKLISAADGVVLEIGPGIGNQLRRFDKSKISRTKCAIRGWRDYEIAACHVEDSDILEKHGISANSVDTVISVQVLCSVHDPVAVMKEMYRVLKPGGKLIFYEHYRSSDWLTAAVQYLLNPLWSFLLGGCNMTRDTKANVAAAGEWENLASMEVDENPWTTFPRAWGVLIKPGSERA